MRLLHKPLFISRSLSIWKFTGPECDPGKLYKYPQVEFTTLYHPAPVEKSVFFKFEMTVRLEKVWVWFDNDFPSYLFNNFNKFSSLIAAKMKAKFTVVSHRILNLKSVKILLLYQNFKSMEVWQIRWETVNVLIQMGHSHKLAFF